LIFCTGQGAWEERMVDETRRLDELLREKRIPAWVDFWGGEVSHDWPWWHRQLVYFMDRWLDDDATRDVA
jgi:esterase/lipase superfamily enzyme